MRYLTFVEHRPAVVLTCEGDYEGPQFVGTLKFMRVSLKQDGRWQLVESPPLSLYLAGTQLSNANSASS
jgi:hypothetical protein